MVTLTQDEKDDIRDVAIKKWWKKWFKADYSWEGLLNKPWLGWIVVEDQAAYDVYIESHGLPKGCPNKACRIIPADYEGLPKGTPTRDANLQDYWRDQEALLESGAGDKKYTIAHIPVQFEVGESWKANPDDEKWQVLYALITDRLKCAVKTEAQEGSSGYNVTGQEKRANFRGCILPALPALLKFRKSGQKNESNADRLSDTDEALHISLYQAAIVHSQNFKGTTFGSTADFRHTLFAYGNTSFVNAQFVGGNASFAKVLFAGGGADFSNAQFSGGHANFVNAQFVGGGADFSHAQFISENTYFTGTKFSGGDANFTETQFVGGRTYFTNAKFVGGNSLFIYANFAGGRAYFRNAKFSGGYTNFTGAEFINGSAEFKNVKFSGGNATFKNAKFTGGFTNFSNANFLGGTALFVGTQFFDGNVSFANVEFSGGSANFNNSQFSGGNVNFDHAKFLGGDANFSRTKFLGGDVSFQIAHFKSSFHFNGAHFEKGVSFGNAYFPPALGSQSAFRGAQFLGPADFSRSNFNEYNEKPATILHFPFNAFDHANIKDQLILTLRGEKAAQIEFDRALLSVATACEADKEDRMESRYVALEQGCTTLKRAMENMSDKNRAQRYFKFELLARQKRPSTPFIVKLFTKLYGLVANYGGSIARPLWTLGAVWVFFALVYGANAYFIAGGPAEQINILWGPIEFSATQIFRPFFIWSKAIATNDTDWLGLYKDNLSSGGWLSVKLLATIQSFVSITLLFLFGLATKRKFQIS